MSNQISGCELGFDGSVSIFPLSHAWGVSTHFDPDLTKTQGRKFTPALQMTSITLGESIGIMSITSVVVPMIVMVP